jgi:hypothetical protein
MSTHRTIVAVVIAILTMMVALAMSVADGTMNFLAFRSLGSAISGAFLGITPALVMGAAGASVSAGNLLSFALASLAFRGQMFGAAFYSAVAGLLLAGASISGSYLALEQGNDASAAEAHGQASGFDAAVRLVEQIDRQLSRVETVREPSAIQAELDDLLVNQPTWSAAHRRLGVELAEAETRVALEGEREELEAALAGGRPQGTAFGAGAERLFGFSVVLTVAASLMSAASGLMLSPRSTATTRKGMKGRKPAKPQDFGGLSAALNSRS